MSGNIVGGVIGAVIGFVVAGPAGAVKGFMIGSAVGGLLFPNKTSGPDLTDLKPQSSEYGRPIPVVFSKAGLDGFVCWASDLVKTSDGSGGGKGSESTTGPTYTANFAVIICESNGDRALRRVWAGAEKRLIYDDETGEMESGTLTFYNGAANQSPDPLMESFLGMGNVPAYRGRALVVVEGFDVTSHDGNRIPMLTFEVGSTASAGTGTTAPEDYGTAWSNHLWYSNANHSILFEYDGSYYGLTRVNAATMATQKRIEYGIAGFSVSSVYAYDEARNTIHYSSGAFADQYYSVNMTTGTRITHNPITSMLGQIVGLCMAGGHLCVVRNASAADGYGYRVALIDTASPHTVTADYFVDVGTTIQLRDVIGADPAYPWFWAIREDGAVLRIDTDGTTSSTVLGIAPTGGGSAMFNPYNGNLYIGVQDGTGARVAAFNSTGPLFGETSYAASFFRFARVPWLFTPGGVYIVGSRWLATDHFLSIDPDTGFSIAVMDGAYVGINNLMGAVYVPATGLIQALRDNMAYATSESSLPWTLPYISGWVRGSGSSPGTGSSEFQYQTLAEVVTDLSLRAGLSESDIDVSELTDQVDGYVLASQMEVKEAIQPLMGVYYFDEYEDQGVIKFKKRGGTLAAEIDDADLGAHADGSTDASASNLIQTTRGMDDELPNTFSVSYILEATNYAQATKYARRLVGHSQSEAGVQLPMVLTDQKAAEVASVNLHDVWVGRLQYKFTLGRKYAYLAPTDLVGIQGQVMRITKITQRGGVYECEAVRDESDTYTPHVIVEETPPKSQTVNRPTLTLFELM